MAQSLDNEAGVVRGPWRAKAGVALVLAAACAGAYWLGSQSVLSPLANGGLTIDPQDLNFGKAVEDELLSLKVPVHNSATREIHVVGFVPSCLCVAVVPASFSLGPSQTRELQFNLDLKRVPKGHEGAWQWPFEVVIEPQIARQTAQQKGWLIRGRVHKLLDVSPRVISFPDQLVRGEPFPERKVNIVAAVPLVDLNATCDTSKIAFKLKRLGPRAYEMTIRPVSTISAGLFKLDIGLEGKGSEANQVAKSSVRVEGTVHNGVVSVPSLVFLGGVPVGQRSSEVIILRSRTRHPFNVGRHTTSSTSLTVEAIALDSKRDRGYRISQDITVAGKHEENVTFVVQQGQDRFNVHVPVSYHGLDRWRTRPVQERRFPEEQH